VVGLPTSFATSLCASGAHTIRADFDGVSCATCAACAVVDVERGEPDFVVELPHAAATTVSTATKGVRIARWRVLARRSG
jgi:hypothetical protein